MHEILYELPKKRLIELRDIRLKRLLDEQKDLEKQQKEHEREMARAQIMQP